MSIVQPFVDLTNLKGINNKLDATQINDKQLVEAVNIDLDDSGLPSRRKGFQYLTINSVSNANQGNIHSLFSDGNWIYFVRNGALYFYNENTTVATSLLTLVGSEVNLRWSYTPLPDGRIFAVNGVRIGYLEANSWTNLETPTGSYKIPLKTGHLSTFYNGRIYIASGNIVWYSDAYRYGQMDGRYNFLQLEGYTTLLEGSTTGIFAADGSTFLLKGEEPESFSYVSLAPYNAILGTASKIDGTLWYEGKQLTGINIIWASDQGICIGSDDGSFYNITNKKYVTPSAKVGASVYRITDNNISQTITVLQN